MSIQADEFCSSAKAAERLGIKHGTLIGWRRRGIGPEYERRNRTIIYRESAIQKFLQDGTVPEGRKPKQPFWPRSSWWAANL